VYIKNNLGHSLKMVLWKKPKRVAVDCLSLNIIHIIKVVLGCTIIYIPLIIEKATEKSHLKITSPKLFMPLRFPTKMLRLSFRHTKHK